jgi:hypothetical protein
MGYYSLYNQESKSKIENKIKKNEPKQLQIKVVNGSGTRKQLIIPGIDNNNTL